MNEQIKLWCAAMLLLIVAATPVAAASQRDREVASTKSDIDAAVSAMAMAERVGAPVYAKALYDEATSRLNFAKVNLNSDKSSVRQNAQLAAVEARAAARAAESKALWTIAVNDATALRNDIVTFGGTAPAVGEVTEPDAPVVRGNDSRSRIATAEAAISRAKTAGVMTFGAAEINDAEGALGSAKKIVKNQKQSDAADHLAYMAEMTARRLEYQARRAEADKLLPGMRLERSRFAKANADRRAAEELAKRQAAEQEAAALRARLAEAEKSRTAQQQELDAMRQQIMLHQTTLQQQLAADRTARLEAEARLADLTAEYQTSVAAGKQQEIDELQRQVSDQQLTVDTLRQRQSVAEQSMRSEVDRLQQALADERARGASSAQVVQQRQADIDRQRQQLDQLQSEREASEQVIAGLRRQQEQASAQLAKLQQQVAVEQQKSQETSAELLRTQAELSAERERTRLQSELAKIAKTTNEARGLVVTLPGIYFDTGASKLKPGATNTLQKIAAQLKANANLKIQVEGHTDSVGSDASNMALSQKRADAVRDALVGSGIPAAAITSSGLGESAPVATNKTVAGRQQNRRVELVITQ